MAVVGKRVKLEDEFNIKGRGKVIAARLEKDEECPSAGFYIDWKDVRYEVVAVESFRTAFGVGRNVGLLVREVTDG